METKFECAIFSNYIALKNVGDTDKVREKLEELERA